MEALAVEAVTTLEGGMVSAFDPRDLNGNQAARMINVESERSIARHRPPFRSPNSTLLPVGRFNGVAWYSQRNEDSIFIGIAGRLYRVVVSGFTMEDQGQSLDSVHWWFQQHNRFMIVQDNANPALIFDPEAATNTRVALPDATNREVPIGSIMASGHGRLFVVPLQVAGAANNNLAFVAGDITLPNDPPTGLKFTETDYLAEGGALGVPATIGEITAMAFTQTQSGSGQGPLVVFGSDGASGFAVNARRADWKNIDISGVVFEGNGTYAPRSVTTFNTDLFYRAIDGHRTLGYSSSQLSTSTIVTDNAVSAPVDDLFDGDTEAQQRDAYGATVKNRVYCLVSPTTAASGETAYRGIARVRASTATNAALTGLFVYDGIWTCGGLIVGLAAGKYQGKDVLYVVRKSASGGNELLVMDADAVPTANDEAPTSRIETRAMAFTTRRNEVPLVSMQHRYMDVSFRDLRGTVTVNIYVRPHDYPYWAPVGSTTFRAGFDVPQVRMPVRIDTANDSQAFCTPWNKQMLTTARRLQYAIEWEGWGSLVEAIAFANPTEVQPMKACELTGEVVYSESSGQELEEFP